MSAASISCSTETRDWVKEYMRRHGLLTSDAALRHMRAALEGQGQEAVARAAEPEALHDAEQPAKKTEAGAADIVGLLRGSRRDPHLLDGSWQGRARVARTEAGEGGTLRVVLSSRAVCVFWGFQIAHEPLLIT
jgi:hypothetical protein